MKKINCFALVLFLVMLGAVGCVNNNDEFSKLVKENSQDEIYVLAISDTEYETLLGKAGLTDETYRDALSQGGIGNYYTNGKYLLKAYVDYNIKYDGYTFGKFLENGKPVSASQLDSQSTLSYIIRAVYNEVSNWGKRDGGETMAIQAVPPLVDLLKNRKATGDYGTDLKAITKGAYNGVRDGDTPACQPTIDAVAGGFSNIYALAFKRSHWLLKYGTAYSSLNTSYIYCYESYNSVPSKLQGEEYEKYGWFYFSLIYAG